MKVRRPTTDDRRYSRMWPSLLAGVVLSSPAAADAQVLYGGVVRNVQDGSGAALPGATVTLTNKGTGLVQTTVTSPEGTISQ